MDYLLDYLLGLLSNIIGHRLTLALLMQNLLNIQDVLSFLIPGTGVELWGSICVLKIIHFSLSQSVIGCHSMSSHGLLAVIFFKEEREEGFTPNSLLTF